MPVWLDPSSGAEERYSVDEDFLADMEAYREAQNCEHLTDLVVVPIAGGGRQVRKQCRKCYELVGSAVARPDLADLPGADLGRRENYRKQAEKIRIEIYRSAVRRERQRQSDWWQRYEEHLSSPAWQDMRVRVLARDDYVCQGCLVEVATEVHHMTYADVGNEFAFQLTSLCAMCHRRFHGKRRGDV